MKDKINAFLKCVLNSYSQIFFSDNKVFAVLLVLVSFADVYAGMAGLISVIITNITGMYLGLDKRVINKGIYGFNSLLVGLCLGIYFSPGLVLTIVIILAAVLTLFIAVSLQGVIGKYGLPYLSIPFLIGAWILTLATRNMSFLGISERGIYTLNELYTVGGTPMVNLYEWWNNVGILRPLRIYFISLGAILFQYNVLSGIIIAAGLLYYSRISFTLSLIGFFTAFYFYDLVGASISELNYSYIGFNYILTSIAIGGFFIIPSIRSYLWVIFLVPIVALFTLSFSTIFASAVLPVYSLPFNLIVLLFLYALKFRINPSKRLSEVVIQQNTPEKNLYSFHNDTERFRHDMIPVKLPFYGTWTVSQDYDGEQTHQGAWKHALDFIITDNSGKQFTGKGDLPEDYFCNNKPVLAPSDGYVESVIDNVEDNIIGKVNLKENWGNTVIIRHNNYLFSSLSHLKKDSITVKPGDKLKQGDIIGKCGNSGRSPYPHLHFQMQTSQYIGSPTLFYPISYYIGHNKSGFELKNFSVPIIDQKISNVETNELLSNGFELIPGKKLCFDTTRNGIKENEVWEISTNEYNQRFIKCLSTEAIAWFSNDDSLFMFQHYDGRKNTLLYYFFQATFKVQLGFYKNLEINDRYPLNLILKNPLLFLQDFVAPFFSFLRSEFTMKYEYIDNEVMTSKITLVSSAVNYIGKHKIGSVNYTLNIDETGINSFEVNKNGITLISATCSENQL
ncbi:MAG TPA: urea transporter [Bacteroidales bacterium]|nr:urea transporter [Bacteroidales bacterium]